MLSITRRNADGTDTEVTIAPAGYRAGEDEMADMYAALFSGTE
jgi:hypothetical protein